MQILKFIFKIIAFIFLTILTQVGGLVYLVSFTTHKFINKKFRNKLLQGTLKFTSFLTLYLIATFLIVPVIANLFGRVPLPLTKSGNLRPLNFLTFFLNRHYVRPELKQTAIDVAKEMNDRFPGTVVNYLDANFPFINNFPLIPHLSHNDGKKLDIAFCYLDNSTKKWTNKTPSPIGYGVSEEPRPGEENMANFCREKGFWQYSFLMKIIPQNKKQDFMFDSIRTKELVNLFTSKSTIAKIFIEPHLKTRLNLVSDKIRFHGCQAVRHDDHLHIQIN